MQWTPHLASRQCLVGLLRPVASALSVRVITALRRGLSSSIRARCASSTSTEETCLDRIAPASWEAVSLVRSAS